MAYVTHHVLRVLEQVVQIVRLVHKFILFHTMGYVWLHVQVGILIVVGLVLFAVLLVRVALPVLLNAQVVLQDTIFTQVLVSKLVHPKQWPSHQYVLHVHQDV